MLGVPLDLISAVVAALRALLYLASCISEIRGPLRGNGTWSPDGYFAKEKGD